MAERLDQPGHAGEHGQHAAPVGLLAHLEHHVLPATACPRPRGREH
jgi:hypothetical protein